MLEPDDPHVTLGVPVGAALYEIQRAFRDEMLRALPEADRSVEGAGQVLAIQGAYRAVAGSAPQERWWTRRSTRQRALTLAFLFLLAALVVGMVDGDAPAALRWVAASIGVLLLLARAASPAEPSDAGSLAAEVERLLARAPRPPRALEVEPPTAGAFLAEPIGTLEGDANNVVFARGAALPADVELRLHAASDEARAVDVELFAFGAAPQRVLHARLHALRPMRAGDVVCVSLRIDELGRIAIAAVDDYAGGSMRVERRSDAEATAPVATAGYRG